MESTDLKYDLLDTIRDYIDKNGGRLVLAHLIVSENPDVFHKGFEATKSELWLRDRGIFSNADVPLYTAMKSRTRFTYEEVRTIKEMADNGATFESIAKKLKRAKAAVSGKMTEMRADGDLPPSDDKRWKAGELSFISENLNEKGNIAIARHLGRSVAGVKAIKSIYGLKMRPDNQVKARRQII